MSAETSQAHSSFQPKEYHTAIDSANAANLIDFLTTFKCKNPLFPNKSRTMVSITNSSTIQEAFEKMIENRISSIPVIHGPTGKPLNVISMMHIAAFMVGNYTVSDFKDDFWHKIYNKSHSFLATKLSDLEGSKEYVLDPAFVVEENSPLLNAFLLMGKTGAHRILVINEMGHVTNMITQSRIIEILSTIVDSLPKSNKTIKNLKLGTRDIVTIHQDQPTFEAFKLMKSKRVTGLPIVDDTGKLVGSISVSDLKLIGYNASYWSMMEQPLKEYIKSIRSTPEVKLHSKTLALLHQESEVPAVRCYEWHTLGFALRHIAYFGVHRIFCVDENLKPTAIVTLTDLIREFLDDDFVQLEIEKHQRR